MPGKSQTSKACLSANILRESSERASHCIVFSAIMAALELLWPISDPGGPRYVD
jgi:hypothetical protein